MVNSAAEIFQKKMEMILAPCKNALNFIDDIVVFGLTEEEHDANLKEVLRVLKEYNVVLTEQKCIWKVRSIKFLGHILAPEGISPDPNKIKTVLEFRPPINKEETRSFLGLVSYLGKFIPDLGDVTEPLRMLIKKDVKFT